MFQRLIDEYQAVNTTLCMVDHSELCLSSYEIQSLKEAVLLLKLKSYHLTSMSLYQRL